MRFTSMLVLLTVAALLAVASPRPTWAADSRRHDGTVETVNARTQTIVIREYGANARAFDFPVHVSPDARIVVSEPNEKAMDARHAFVETPIHLLDIKPGDFVVVDVTGRGAHAQTHSVVVTLRGAK